MANEFYEYYVSEVVYTLTLYGQDPPELGKRFVHLVPSRQTTVGFGVYWS